MYSDKEILNFCYNVKALREKNGLSKKEMAQLLGIGVETLKKIESGVIPPRTSVNVIFEICNSFNILPKNIFNEALDK